MIWKRELKTDNRIWLRADMKKSEDVFESASERASEIAISMNSLFDTVRNTKRIDQTQFAEILSLEDIDLQLKLFSALASDHCRLSSFDIVGNLFSFVDEQKIGSYSRYRQLVRMIVRLGYCCTDFDLKRGLKKRKLYFVRFVIEMLPVQKILAEEIKSEGLISQLFTETDRLRQGDLSKTSMLLKLLLLCGCEINYKDRIGETCLQKLCRRRNTPVEFFSLVLSFGADKRQRIFGKLPFDLARNSAQCIEVLGLLRL